MAENPQEKQTMQQAQAPANTNAAPEFDASFFAQNNRLHIEDGSQFLPFNFLMISPKELSPENQQRTFAKIIKHLSIPAPSFFAVPQRAMVMEAMASFLPISKEAHLNSIKEATEKLEVFAQTGMHPDNEEGIDKYKRPFVANAKLRSEQPKIDPIDQEYLQNATLLYLVLNEALTKQGRPQEPAAYVRHYASADSVLGDMSDKLNIPMSEIVETLQTKGVDGFASKLGVDTALVKEMREVVQLSAQHLYADNIIGSWDAGRHVQGMENRSIDEKVAVGVLQRAGGLMQMLQQSMPHDAPTPEDVKQQEKMITSILRELPEPLQKAMYYSGMELGFIKGSTLGHIMPMLQRAAGVNMHVPFEYGGDDGLRLIINSNLEDLQKTRTILHHEANHLFFPKQMGEDGIAKLDELMTQNAKRLQALKGKLDAWKIADTKAEKQAIEAQIDKEFHAGDVGLGEALNRNSANPIGMDTLHGWVDHALHNLNPDSPQLSKGYPIPELRAAEIISRFAELQFVKLEDNPAMLGFIAPQLMVGYHDIYLPHIEKQVQQIKNEQQQLPENLRYIGLPPQSVMAHTQQIAMDAPQAALTAMPAMTQQSAINMNAAATPQPIVETSSIAAHMPSGAAQYLDKVRLAHESATLAEAPADLTR